MDPDQSPPAEQKVMFKFFWELSAVLENISAKPAIEKETGTPVEGKDAEDELSISIYEG